MLRCPAGNFPKLNIRKWIYVKTKNKNVMPNIHIVDRYFSAVKKIGVTNDNLGLDFFGEEEIDIPFGKYAVIVCGATHTTKQIPPKHIAKLAEKINGNIVLVGDKHDDERLKSIDITGKDNILNMCGKCTLAQSAYIVKNADIVITADTGLMHIAAAYKKDIITIWGNTTPQLGMYPYIPSIKNKYISIEVDNLPCRPCSKIGYNQCPKKDFKCMNNINLSKVIEHTNNNLL
jgi:heptosyltransferase-2